MNFGDNVQIKGCQIKARFLESSSGNSSVDNLLGGALPNSSVTILDEPQSRVYAETLTKYFLSEGLHSDHDLLVVDPCSSGTDLYTGLPSKVENAENSSARASDKEDMKIAWRYESAPKVNSAVGTKSRYDLGKQLTDLSLFGSQMISFPTNKAASYKDLLKFIKERLDNDTYSKNKQTRKNLLRIVIRNLGSPLWEDPQNLSMFLACLQSMTRNSYCLMMITTCSSSLSLTEVSELEASADCFFRLVAMTDEEKKSLPALDKAHGYFYIVKLPRLVSVATYCPSAVDLTFELHRRSFDVKILHLPPALNGPEPIKTACSSVDF